jgi:hypothetical protein
MKWVTRKGAKTDRVACPWLIRKFIDHEAEFLFVPAEQVLDVARDQNGKSFDAPGADFTHRNGKCSFEVLAEDFSVDDPTVGMLARIVHGADIPSDISCTTESAGLLAIAEGFALVCEDDLRKLELEFPVYDALYAWCKKHVATTNSPPHTS